MLACIPVVVISAASDRYLHEAESLGADAVLGKPFDLDALSTAVRKIVS
jgi:CheY-like chemotaxis protein